jgi:hypothetical protein
LTIPDPLSHTKGWTSSPSAMAKDHSAHRKNSQRPLLGQRQSE